jgi:hypothetical protein
MDEKFVKHDVIAVDSSNMINGTNAIVNVVNGGKIKK